MIKSKTVKKRKRVIFSFICAGFLVVGNGSSFAQDTVHYTGKVLSNVDYHHGQLSPVMGVHNIQVLRANRENPDARNGMGWTYNHAPMLAYVGGTYYLQYLSNPVGEHIPPGQTFLMRSTDGYNWTDPVVAFPPYKVPEGFTKKGNPNAAKDLFGVMHQRMGFYLAQNGTLLTVGYYGIALDQKDDPNDGNGIGRVVRKINKDGSLGPIHFLRYNHDFNEKNTDHPFYKKSRDKAFVAACDELLSQPLMMQQWNEEADRDDPLIPVKKEYKAFNFYHLNNGDVVGLWKHALTSISKDGGKSWVYNPLRAPGFVNSNAKIWGQRTSDGKFATVYNPSEFRWPLALSVSADGLEYTNLLLVNGEITPMRYGGNYKSYGPQYVRGILEGNGTPPDGNMWVTYSMNKEDIWVSRIPVPIKDRAEHHVADDFSLSADGKELEFWNIYSPLQAPVKIQRDDQGIKVLSLSDEDAFDYAKAERLFPSSKKVTVSFSVKPMQDNFGQLQFEIQDAKGNPGMRLIFDKDSLLKAKTGARFKRISEYRAGKEYEIKIELSTKERMYRVFIDGKPAGGSVLFFAPLSEMQRIVFRTGEPRRFPSPETPADNFTDLPNAGAKEQKASYLIRYVKTTEE